jgi:hypothetical protein
MHRWLLSCLLCCLCAARIGEAQEFRAWNRTVQVHGFLSQGFVKTDHNNWLTMNTHAGSGAMTDMGLNMSSQLTDKFRLGAQVYDRNLGQLGQWHPSLDWAVADYRFTNWLGVRAGKVKTTLGLYNDSQDLDFLRVFALLPQGVYPTDLRDTTMAHAGADVYGDIGVAHHLGKLAYTAYVGQRSDSLYSGYPYMVQQWGVFFQELGGLQYGADLRWNTPLEGLLIGASRINQALTGKGKYVNLLNPLAGRIPYRTSTNTDWANQFYSQYLYRRLRLDAEYRRFYDNTPYVPGSNIGTDVRAWYVMGSYRIHKHMEVGSYYSRYNVRHTFAGLASAFGPANSDLSLPQNHIYDKVIAARVDLNRFVFVKLEGHFMDGYGFGAYPNGFYPGQNPSGFQPSTKAVVLKTGFKF